MKKPLVIRDKNVKLIAKEEYLAVVQNSEKRVISYKHLKEIYINLAVKVNINTCYKISKKLPLYFIDSNDYIVAKLCKK